MKKNYFLKVITCFVILFSSNISSQNQGHIAFTAFNADVNGNTDFSIVALADIPANSIIYFSNDESNPEGNGFLNGNLPLIKWDSGSNIIKAGRIIIFNDLSIDARTVSEGIITDLNGPFVMNPSGDAIFAIKTIGDADPSNTDNISTWLTGIENKIGLEGANFSKTGLILESTFTQFTNSVGVAGAYFNGSRSDKDVTGLYSDYLGELGGEGNWIKIATNGETILPISTEAFTTHTTTWNGNVNTLWKEDGNWSAGAPTSSSLVTIPDCACGFPIIGIISSPLSVLAGNLTINKFTSIAGSTSLTVNGNITNNNTIVLRTNANGNNSSSLIVKGTYTAGANGRLTYVRSLTTNWHLVSSPIKGALINDISTLLLNGTSDHLSLAPYDNSLATGNRWVYYTTNAGSNPIGATDEFNGGKGYAIKVNGAANGSISITSNNSEALLTTDFEVPITDNSSGSNSGNNKWNLVGNPYPSFLHANANADDANSFLIVNAAKLNPSSTAIYFWNAATGNYDIINNANTAAYIAPGQGFFVEAVNGGATLDFTEAMQTHQEGDLFLRNQNNNPKIILSVTAANGTPMKSTQIKYFPSTNINITTGLDQGYDATPFTGGDVDFNQNNFGIYTRLVDPNAGLGTNPETDFALQVLPDNDYEKTVIPLNLNIDSGTEVTFSAEALNLPKDIEVYLEDKESTATNKIIYLGDGELYTAISSDTQIGRFFLHTNTSQVLGTDDLLSNTVRIYKTNNKNIRITGLQNSKNASVTLFNILGKQIMTQSFQVNNGNKDISLPNSISSGLYIVQLQTEVGKLSTKIIVE